MWRASPGLEIFKTFCLESPVEALPQSMARVNLVSVKSPGEVTCDAANPTATSPDLSAFKQQGDISLINSALIDVSGEHSGEVMIRGGRLMLENSCILANTFGQGDGQGIDV